MDLAGWHEEYATHPAWGIIEETTLLIDELQVSDPKQQANLLRITSTLQIVLEWRETPSLLISRKMLDDLGSAVRNHIKQPLDQYRHAKNDSLVVTAYNHLHTVLEIARGWPPTKDRQARAITATMRQVAKESEKELQSLRDDIKGVRAEVIQQVAWMKKTTEDQKKTAETRLQQHQDAISSAQEALKAITAKGDQISTRLDNVLSAQQATFSKAEAERLSKHQQMLDSERQKFREAMEVASEKSDEGLSEQLSSGQGILERLKELQAEAEEVVGAVGTASTANWYRDHADDQKRIANTWRYVAIGAFVAAFAIGFVWLVLLDHEDDSWRDTALKGTLSLSLLAAATYAIHESSQHRSEEFRARSIQLKLRALDPFIATIDEAGRQHLKRDMARQIFIGGVEFPTSIDEDQPVEIS